MHDPSGQGQAAGIRRRAKPALLHSRVPGTQVKKGWRNRNDTQTEDINVYVVFKEGEMTFEEDGEKVKQWAVVYNVEQRLNYGDLLELPDVQNDKGENRRFLIKKSAQRPARTPKYYKAWGVEAN